MAVVEVGTSLTVVLSRSRSASRRPPRSGARAGRSGIGADLSFRTRPYFSPSLIQVTEAAVPRSPLKMLTVLASKILLS